MAWVDLEIGILEDFASFAHYAHEHEWRSLAAHENRANNAVASETLNLDEALAGLRRSILAPELTRGLAVNDLLAKRNEFLSAAAEKEEAVRRDKAKKIGTSARASRHWYERLVNDGERSEQRLADRRRSRRERKHEGQVDFDD